MNTIREPLAILIAMVYGMDNIFTVIITVIDSLSARLSTKNSNYSKGQAATDIAACPL